MRHDSVAPSKRKPVNLSLDTGVVEAARAAGINLSQVSEAALRVATKKAAEAQWKSDNREWIEAHNAWVEKNGIPLSDLRVL